MRKRKRVEVSLESSKIIVVGSYAGLRGKKNVSSVFGLLQKMSHLDWQCSREHECSKMYYSVMTGFGVQGV